MIFIDVDFQGFFVRRLKFASQTNKDFNLDGNKFFRNQILKPDLFFCIIRFVVVGTEKQIKYLTKVKKKEMSLQEIKK